MDTSFEEVNKMVKKTETRVAQDRHLEIDNLEVERVAQPLCIYEPYYGSGAWPFLHRDHLLYKGLSLVCTLVFPSMFSLVISGLSVKNWVRYEDVVLCCRNMIYLLSILRINVEIMHSVSGHRTFFIQAVTTVRLNIFSSRVMLRIHHCKIVTNG